jgi:hypothetical protein
VEEIIMKEFNGFKESYRPFPENLEKVYVILNISPKYEDLCFRRDDGVIQYLTSRIKNE